MWSSELNWLILLVAKVMSGWVAIEAYMRDPTPARYGIFCMAAFRFSKEGDMVVDSITFGCNGIETP